MRLESRGAEFSVTHRAGRVAPHIERLSRHGVLRRTSTEKQRPQLAPHADRKLGRGKVLTIHR